MGQYEDQHRADWTRAAGRAVQAQKRYTDQIAHEYLFLRTFEREGVATALDTAARRVTVNLLPVQGAAGSTVSAAYGQPTFKASDVGKAVRVWERVESRLEPPPGGMVIVSRTYTIDTVLGA
jgi:hypothetical protein